MTIEAAAQRLDRIAGGRHAEHRIDERMRTHPATRRAFAWIRALLVVELVLGLGAVVVAVVLAGSGADVAWPVWMRTVVVLGITATLFYFTWRASLGYYWAYSRLRLFAKIFPVVTLVLAAIPGLYPLWMVTEQIAFSLVLIGVADFLDSRHMRVAYPPPER